MSKYSRKSLSEQEEGPDKGQSLCLTTGPDIPQGIPALLTNASQIAGRIQLLLGKWPGVGSLHCTWL